MPVLAGRRPLILGADASERRRHAFLRYLAEQIRTRLSTATDNRLAKMDRPLTGRSGESVTSLAVDLSAWDHGDAVAITVTVLRGKEAVARESIRVSTAAIPRHFKPLTAQGGEVGGARSRLMLSGTPGTRSSATRLAADGAFRLDTRRALAERAGGEGFGRYFPTDEVWLGDPSSPTGLDARRPTAGPAGERAALSLHAHRLVAGEPIRITVDPGIRRVEAALFALQADDTVLRLYPGQVSASMQILLAGRSIFPPGHHRFMRPRQCRCRPVQRIDLGCFLRSPVRCGPSRAIAR